MKVWLAAAVLLVACKSKLHAPDGAHAVASCDYTSKTFGTNHSCTEIYDEARIPAHEDFCNSLQGPRNHGVFTKGTGCPDDGRTKGCLQADGSIVWVYQGHHTCFGKEFTGAVPAHGAPQPFHCSQPTSCLEQWSVFDLATTVEKPNCATTQGTFGSGPCPTDKSVGRCTMNDGNMALYRVFYAPETAEQAKAACEQQYEGTFAL
jgi:hypothetical protein